MVIVFNRLYSEELKLKHERVLSELIRRDKNYASAIMWSLANEPRTQHNESEPYFRSLYLNASFDFIFIFL